MEENTQIKVGDFVFCLGEGMAIFPVESVDKTGAFLGMCVGPLGEFGTGGSESLHKLTLVDDSEWASNFPEFCRCPAFFRAAGGAVCGVCDKEYHDHPQLDGFPFLNVICGGMVVKL